MKIANIEVTPVHPERWGDDLDVVNAARVSMAKYSDKMTYSDERLVRYLAQHKHFSPFNHSFLSFRVKAPIFVARQLVKHKFMPWNEVSRRYVDEEPEFYYPDYWRKRGENIKQGSLDERNEAMYVAEDDEMGVYPSADEWVIISMESAMHQYEYMLKLGVPPEQARMILPQNMMTEWIWSGTLGAFLDMLVLRLDPHTQKESRDVANLIAMHVQKKFPVSFEARIKQ